MTYFCILIQALSLVKWLCRKDPQIKKEMLLSEQKKNALCFL